MNRADILFRLEQTIGERRGTPPESSYVAALHHKGVDAILKKVGEEAIETILAAKESDRTHLTRECADLVFHLLVLLGERDIPLEHVLAELERREGVSGIAEKQSRSPS